MRIVWNLVKVPGSFFISFQRKEERLCHVIRAICLMKAAG